MRERKKKEKIIKWYRNMAFSYQSSRKNSTNVSANELYYITRNVFKRNKAF